jgi:hypothetical protein
MAKYNKGLFEDWVPKPVQLLLIIIFLLVLSPMSPIYVGNVYYMVGDTGSMTEYFTWANYAGTIGMGAAMPVNFRIKMRFKIRDKVFAILLLLALFNFIIATTKEPMVIVTISLFMGFFKMLILMEFMLPLMVILNPDGNRGKFYAVFYPFILGSSQIGGYLTTLIAFHRNWQAAYFEYTLLCLLLAVLCIIFMHKKHFDKPLPLYYIDWFSGLLFMFTFMLLAYVLAFGKQQDWFVSKRIVIATVGILISFTLMVYRQSILKYPYLSFKIFKRNNVLHGMLMLLMLGMFMALTSVQNVFTMNVLNYDAVHNGNLNLMMLPGFIVAGIFAYKWFNKQKPIKYYIFSGFVSMMLYSLIMYFYMVPELNYERWFLPMFLRGFGMCALFIAAWFYTLDKLLPNDMMPVIGTIMVWRTFIAVGIFSSLYSWLQYQFQIESIGTLAIYYDGTNLTPQNVSTNLKSIQVNAILAANKRLIGYVLIAGIGVLVYVLTHHYGKERYILVKLKELMDASKQEYRAEKKEEKFQVAEK